MHCSEHTKLSEEAELLLEAEVLLWPLDETPEEPGPLQAFTQRVDAFVRMVAIPAALHFGLPGGSDLPPAAIRVDGAARGARTPLAPKALLYGLASAALMFLPATQLRQQSLHSEASGAPHLQHSERKQGVHGAAPSNMTGEFHQKITGSLLVPLAELLRSGWAAGARL